MTKLMMNDGNDYESQEVLQAESQFRGRSQRRSGKYLRSGRSVDMPVSNVEYLSFKIFPFLTGGFHTTNELSVPYSSSILLRGSAILTIPVSTFALFSQTSFLSPSTLPHDS